ncbi:DUF349 domain-containing protein [Colwellia sp. RSH04]|uniref:DUF349 domain-containing protein n=1 Tax=Colwellia sp. RSH04 TaxID=2305464 RepID=UPI000E59362F|nr:DUF349 domain-containing protein [Colwellia sp. RSH04]RHW77151.1 DUF349 domain-containing protein [Colwellia sp. RSH04]
MIFSSLFKNKNNWQSKNSTTRIEAIQHELSCCNDIQRQVLCDLYTNDESELVRKAALIKLNSFIEYLAAYEQNSNKKINEFAKKQLLLILQNEHDIKLSSDEKINFIQIKPILSVAELDRWLTVEQDTQVVLALFNYLKEKKSQQGKSYQQFVLHVFTQHQDEELQKQLIDECNDLNALEKMLKKSSITSISEVISQKITALHSATEKPIKINKHLNLLVSKFLALKDIVLYEEYLSKRNELEAQWQKAQVDLAFLDDESQKLLINKFNDIDRQLTQIFAVKAENYLQEQIAKELQVTKQRQTTQIKERITHLNKAITKAVFESESIEDDSEQKNSFKSSLSETEKEILQSSLNSKEQSVLLSELNNIKQKLSDLPKIAESVSQATQLISKMSQVVAPNHLNELNDKQALFSQWLTDWKRVVIISSGVLPDSIVEAYQEIKSTWDKALRPLQQEQKQILSQVRKKLTDIKRLLSQGKYKVCFGLFKGVNQQYVLLSEKQQTQLQRDYNAVSEKISELNDWEHYIATPRKQELLDQIQLLVDTPLDNPNEQAAKVKAFRKQWNMLGHADEVLDNQLNDQFNNACEIAFSPCRQFYAEQEKLRAAHLEKRQSILTLARELASSVPENDQEVDFKALDAQVNKLQQSWLDAGEVDRSVYRPLNDEFKVIIGPIKKIIKDFQQRNLIAKENLIELAEKALTNDDVFQSIDLVKQYQQKWRNIGFAGASNENKLWQRFRKINDAIFAKRDDVKTEQQQAQQAVENDLLEKLSELESAFKSKSPSEIDSSHVNALKVKATSLHDEVLSIKPVLKIVLRKVEDLIKSLNETLNLLNAQAKQQNWQSLFVLLTEYIGAGYSVEQINEHPCFDNLLPLWQKRLSECLSQTNEVDYKQRANKTLEIEVLAQVDSPDEFSSERMAVQVQLMQHQMQSGAVIDLEKSFVEWLQLGKLSVDDTSLLNRLKPVFC